MPPPPPPANFVKAALAIDGGPTLECYFNPTEYSISKSNEWTYEKVTGKQVNMVSQSWDGKRVYITSSLLGNWDKKGADDEQFLKLYSWDGKELKPTFELDFNTLKLGRPHHMLFGSTKMGGKAVASK